MAVQSLFPTLVYHAPLMRRGGDTLRTRLLRECLHLPDDDLAGQRWSRHYYPGGYTSYGSVCRLHHVSPTFAELERRLQRHVTAFADSLQWDLDGRALVMTDCWVNLMPPGVVHSLHLHPQSVVSGTYYVRTPARCSGLKLEDPRLDRFMAAPPRHVDADRELRSWVTLPATAGHLTLFESWLRHEVPPNPAKSLRISISFNYALD
ncbi:MAG: TIGR02466 family protein [Gammaproteobacteria bacterium]